MADLSPLITSISNFSGNVASYNQIKQQGEALLGPDWQIHFIRAIEKLKEDKKTALMEKYNAFVAFGKALDIWNEASRLKNESDYENAKFTLSDFETWLPKFGNAGNDLLSQIKERMQPANTGEKASPDAFLTEVVDKELLWELDNFIRVFTYLDQSKSILSMLALRQNINFEEYKYYGFINDLYDYLIEKGMSLLANKDKLRQILPQKIAGGAPALEQLLEHYREEKRLNFNPEAVTDNVVEGLTAQSIKDKIGELAKTEGLAEPDTPLP